MYLPKAITRKDGERPVETEVLTSLDYIINKIQADISTFPQEFDKSSISQSVKSQKEELEVTLKVVSVIRANYPYAGVDKYFPSDMKDREHSYITSAHFAWRVINCYENRGLPKILDRFTYTSGFFDEIRLKKAREENIDAVISWHLVDKIVFAMITTSPLSRSRCDFGSKDNADTLRSLGFIIETPPKNYISLPTPAIALEGKVVRSRRMPASLPLYGTFAASVGTGAVLGGITGSLLALGAAGATALSYRLKSDKTPLALGAASRHQSVESSVVSKAEDNVFSTLDGHQFAKLMNNVVSANGGREKFITFVDVTERISQLLSKLSTAQKQNTITSERQIELDLIVNSSICEVMSSYLEILPLMTDEERTDFDLSLLAQLNSVVDRLDGLRVSIIQDKRDVMSAQEIYSDSLSLGNVGQRKASYQSR